MRLESREVAEELLGITATNACGGMTFNGLMTKTDKQSE